MYKESWASGLSANCRLVLTHTVLLHKPVLQHTSFTQSCWASEATVLLSWSSELQCKWGRGKLERKSPSWKRAGPPTGWSRACSQVTLETSMAVTFSLLFQPNTLPPQSPSNPSNHLQIKNLTNMFIFLLWASAAEALLCCSVFVSVPQDQVPQYQGKKDFLCVHYVHTEFSLIRVWNHCNTNYLH